MDTSQTQSDLATQMAEALQAELQALAVKFNSDAQEIGEKFGLKLITEVSFSIESKKDQEGL